MQIGCTEADTELIGLFVWFVLNKAEKLLEKIRV